MAQEAWSHLRVNKWTWLVKGMAYPSGQDMRPDSGMNMKVSKLRAIQKVFSFLRERHIWEKKNLSSLRHYSSSWMRSLELLPPPCHLPKEEGQCWGIGAKRWEEYEFMALLCLSVSGLLLWKVNFFVGVFCLFACIFNHLNHFWSLQPKAVIDILNILLNSFNQ